MITVSLDLSERRKGKAALRMMTEPDDPSRHSPHIKNKGIQKRESTISATYLAKNVLAPLWLSNAVFEASSVYGRTEPI